MSQFRQNPITKHWVLIAPNRAKRPEQFGGSAVIPKGLPEVVPACVFCPGNESKNTEISRYPNNPDWQLRIIENKFEALSHVPLSRHAEFYVNRSGDGEHEVIISRKHNEPVALQSAETVRLTLQIFKQRIFDLSKRPDIAYVQIFHNHGRDAGASLIHPHYQILATPIVPQILHDEILGCYHYYKHSGTCIYCDIIKEESKQKERVIFNTEHFIVLAPYASRSPFETWIVPKKHYSNFEDISDLELNELAYVIKVTLGQLYIKLSDPPLNFYIHTMPLAKHFAYEKNAYHWHITVFPRITIWAGFEYATGIPVNPMPPETAAEFLR